MNNPKDPCITSNDDYARNNKCNDEKCSLTASTICVWHNGAGFKVWIVIKFTPNLKECWKLESITEDPTKNYHCINIDFSVDSRINTVMCNHNVTVKKNN